MLAQYSIMKILPLCFVAALSVLGCRDSPIPSRYKPVLPDLPPHWEDIPGDTHWYIQWIGESGNWQDAYIAPGQEAPRMDLMQEWTTPVIAWPFWPAHKLLPGMMRPCGALFPWDSNGEKILLGWEGGVEAIFWKELAVSDRPAEASGGRLPWYFDWPRFRDLLSSENIPAAVRQDLWLPDWKGIAGKTVQSGFDRRRIVSRTFSEITIPEIGGHWIGSSPFAASLDAGLCGPLVLKASGTPDTWVSTDGVLKCSSNGWVFLACQ